MKKKLLVLFSFFYVASLFSQAEPMALEEWRTTAGKQYFYYASNTKTDAFGNVIVAGATMNGATTDILVAKYSPAGNQLWIQQFAGTAPGGVDFSGGLFVTDTYVFITGAISNNTLVPETDCVTMKLASSTGSVVWSTTYNGAGNSHDMGKHIIADGSGNVFVTGASYNGSWNTDYLCLAYNSSGVQQWASTWDYLGFDDAATKVAISGVNLNITGAVTTATPNAYTTATIKLSQATGSLLATTVSTAITTTSVDVVTDLASDGSGNIVVVGTNNVLGEGKNFYVQKVSNTLAPTWTYTYNGAASLDDVAKAIQIDASGNVYIAGFSTSSTLAREVTLIKLNSSGVQQWVQTSGFAGDDEALDLVVSSSGDAYVTGYRTQNSLQNYYTAKYDNTGAKVWEKEMDSNIGLNDYATNITLDSLNNIIVTGQTETAPGNYVFTTVKYHEHDVITPTDFNGEFAAPYFMYYRNSGQILDTNYTSVSDIRYYTHNSTPSFYFKSHSQSIVFSKIDTVALSNDTLHRIDIDFNDCLETAETFPLEEQEYGYLNYFLSSIDSEGITGVKGNQRLITPNLYPDIDLMCSSNQNGIKYYFIVKPGGDIRDIKLEFTGATSYSLDGTTNELAINSPIGSLTFDRPSVYQLTALNTTVAVTGWTPDWQTNGAANKYKFNDGAYTSSLTLVIQVDQGNTITSTASSSLNCQWSTYVGGGSMDVPTDAVSDNSNNLYITGYTTSSNYPPVPNTQVFQGTKSGSTDGFLDMYSYDGTRIFSTFLGGPQEDYMNSMDIAPDGDLYAVGRAASTLLTAPKAGASSTLTAMGAEEAFIFQVSPNGKIRRWLTYYGGADNDEIMRCKFDGLGNLFIIGRTSSTNLPIVGTGSQYTHTNDDPSPATTKEAFIAKFNTSSHLDWSTFVGSTDGVATDFTDSFIDLDFDTNNDVYVAGYMSGSDFPVVPNANTNSTNFSHQPGDQTDGAVCHFSNNGDFIWSTCMGATGFDYFTGIKVLKGKVYLTGFKQGSNFQTQNSGNWYYKNATGVFNNALFVVFDAAKDSLLHSTTIAGNSNVLGWDLAVDTAQNVYVAGQSRSSIFPTPYTQPAATYYETFQGGVADMFIYAFAPGDTNIVWATFIGGTNDEGFNWAPGGYVDINNQNVLHIAGLTLSSANFPLFTGPSPTTYFDGSQNSGWDVSITRFNLYPINFIDYIKEKNSSFAEFLVYPNPTNSVINVKLNSWKERTFYYIYNTLGQTVKEGMFAENSEANAIELSDLTHGLYILEVKQKNAKATVKFIKRD